MHEAQTENMSNDLMMPLVASIGKRHVRAIGEDGALAGT
jgi:hypothetical protein